MCDCGEGTLVLDGLKVCVSSNGLCLCEDNVVGNKCDACEVCYSYQLLLFSIIIYLYHVIEWLLRPVKWMQQDVCL